MKSQPKIARGEERGDWSGILIALIFFERAPKMLFAVLANKVVRIFCVIFRELGKSYAKYWRDAFCTKSCHTLAHSQRGGQHWVGYQKCTSKRRGRINYVHHDITRAKASGSCCKEAADNQHDWPRRLCTYMAWNRLPVKTFFNTRTDFSFSPAVSSLFNWNLVKGFKAIELVGRGPAGANWNELELLSKRLWIVFRNLRRSWTVIGNMRKTLNVQITSRLILDFFWK